MPEDIWRLLPGGAAARTGCLRRADALPQGDGELEGAEETTLAQGELPADPGILRTVARANPVVSGLTFMPGAPIRAVAGVYADVERPGIVRVGDAVRLK